MDTDYAMQMAEFVKLQILENVSALIISHTKNLNRDMVMSLLK